MKIKKPTPAGAVLAGVVLVLSLALVPAAFAGKGGGHGGGSGGSSSGSITGPVMVTDLNGDGQPNWDDTVRFNISTTATQPYVDLKCYQAGVFVGEWTQGYFVGALDTGNFVLKAPMWLGGAADCTATLEIYTKSWQALASLSFHVNA